MLVVLTACEMALAGVTGAVAGSFASTAVLRLTAARSPWTGRSCCDGCGRTLSWRETVPLVGYARARGQCAACGQEINLNHPIGEALGLTIAVSAWVAAPNEKGVLLALLGLLLLGLSLFDIRTLRLPDIGNLMAAVICTGLALLDARLTAGLIAAAASGTVLYLLKTVLERRSGRPALGLGDIKLVMALALALGSWTPLMLAGASLLGLAAIRLGLTRVDGRLPFGPAIAVAAFVTLLVLGSFHGAGT